jgi:hypothetical protein
MMLRLRSAALHGAIATLGLSVACSDATSTRDDDGGLAGTDGSGATAGAGGTAGTDSAGTGSGAAGATSSGASGGTSGAGPIIPVPTAGASNAGAAGGGNGTPETCDGVDNDANGVIDDVDSGGDGICDCIRIATVGLAGEWGEGDVFAQWLTARASDGAHDLNDQVLTAALLSEFQIVVVQDVSKMDRTYAAEEVAALEAWVRQGGGLMTLIGYADADEIENVNLLLAPFGLSYGSQQILQKNGGSTVPISGWEAHPITEGITAVGVDNGYPVTGGGTLFANEGGFDVGRALEVDLGHVEVWGDEWITYNTEWTEHPDYQVERFWVNSIKWLSPIDECQVPVPDDIR